MITNSNLQKATTCLHQGQIIAYPTEAVYGLGCDPFNEHAVLNLLNLKQRDSSKGLILIASSWDQIKSLIKPLNQEQVKRINNTWPGPVTWVFPASPKAPQLIVGGHDTIAIRVTDHYLAKALCESFRGPIVSTSANIAGHPPARTIAEVTTYFPDKIAFILSGQLGNLSKPTQIRDALTGKTLRD